MSMQNVMMILSLQEGVGFTAPPGMQPRGVFDVLGNIEAHIEVATNIPMQRCYEVKVAYPGGPVPPMGLYLGHVASAYGTDIRHFYAVDMGVKHAG